MADEKVLRRIGAKRRGRSIVLTCFTDDGATITLLASDDQVDRLVDELEDALNSPDESDLDETP